MNRFESRMTPKVPGRIREGDVVRAKSNGVREGNGGRSQGRYKWKEKSFCFVVVKFEPAINLPKLTTAGQSSGQLCESRGGRPGLPSLINRPTVSVDVMQRFNRLPETEAASSTHRRQETRHHFMILYIMCK